jgi:putative DNA primase/helicase
MSETIFAKHAKQLHKNGYQPIPVEPRSKGTKIKGWSKYSTEKISADQLDQWIEDYPNHNIGIVCGPASGVVCIDIDADLSIPEHKTAWEKLKSFLPKSPIEKIGSKLPCGLFKYTGEKSESFRIAGKTFIEILGPGKQTVTPPSIHPTTNKEYRYTSTGSLDDVAAEDLPEIPADFIEQIRALVSEYDESGHKSDSTKEPSSEGPTEFPDTTRNTTLTRIAGALRHLGMQSDILETALTALNLVHCRPPIEDHEVIRIAKSISGYPSENDWKTPGELPNVYPNVPSLDPEMIPEALRESICGIASDLQVPTEMILMPTLVCLGSLNGSSVQLRPDRYNNGWLVSTNLSGILIARSGERKSPIFNATVGPIYELQKEFTEKFVDEEEKAKGVIADLNIEIDILKAEDRKLLKEEPPDKSEIKKGRDQIRRLTKDAELAMPKEKRLITNDSTGEALGQICIPNGYALMNFRDELTGLFEAMERPGREGERQFWLEATSGMSRGFFQDRIGRGKVYIPRMTVSMLGGAQPVRMQEMLTHVLAGGGDDGLIQRFQCIVWPDGVGKFKRKMSAHKIDAREEFLKLYRIFSKSRETLPGRRELLSDDVYVPFSSAADFKFGKWNADLQNQLREGVFAQAPAYESYKNKQPQTLVALAGIHQFLEWANLPAKPKDPSISVESVNWAIEMVKYFEEHARKLYSCILFRDRVSARALAQKILEGRVVDGMPKRLIYRPNWAGLNNLTFVDLALAVLEEINWIRIETKAAEGRPSEIIRINPAILSRVSTKNEFGIVVSKKDEPDSKVHEAPVENTTAQMH